MSSEKIRDITDAYPITDHDVLSKVHELKASSRSSSGSQRILRLYTDGSCFKDANHPLRTTFSGWGFCLNEFKEGGSKIVHHEYGHILDGSPLMGELDAIRNGLKNINSPSLVSIVTDSLDAINMLRNPSETKNEYEKFKSQKRHGCKRARELLSAIKAIDELDGKNIVAAEISWVRAHQVDHISDHEMPSVSEADNYEDKLLLMDLIGNKLADKLAKSGAQKAVRSALNGVARAEQKVKDKIPLIEADRKGNITSKPLKKEVANIKKSPSWRIFVKLKKQFFQNINGSWSAKKEAIEAMSKNRDSYLTEHTKNSIFTEQDLKAIQQAKFENSDRKRRTFVDLIAKMNNTATSCHSDKKLEHKASRKRHSDRGVGINY